LTSSRSAPPDEVAARAWNAKRTASARKVQRRYRGYALRQRMCRGLRATLRGERAREALRKRTGTFRGSPHSPTRAALAGSSYGSPRSPYNASPHGTPRSASPGGGSPRAERSPGQRRGGFPFQQEDATSVGAPQGVPAIVEDDATSIRAPMGGTPPPNTEITSGWLMPSNQHAVA
jgi:hypothetical protein